MLSRSATAMEAESLKITEAGEKPHQNRFIGCSDGEIEMFHIFQGTSWKPLKTPQASLKPC